MATPLRTRALRPSLFHLPPALRVSAFQATTAQRTFTSTSTPTSAPFTLVDLAVTPPSYLLDLLHTSLGLPWYAVLPATALVVRSSLLYYLSARNDRRKQGLQANLIPVVAARTARQLNSPEAEQRRRRTPPFLRPFLVAVKGYLTRRNEFRTLEKQFGIWRFRDRAGWLVNFGFLIAVTEAVRMRCGSREGLLPLVLHPFEKMREALFGKAPSPSPESAAASGEGSAAAARGLSEDQLRAAMVTDADGNVSVDFAQLQQAAQDLPPAPTAYSASFDPSLQLEGLPWCLDLTLPDTSFILPTSLVLIIASGIIFRPGQSLSKPARSPPSAKPSAPTTTTSPSPSSSSPTQQQPPLPTTPPFRLLPRITNLQRLQLSILFPFWLAALQFPAAIVLYIASSSAVTQLQKLWVYRKMVARGGGGVAGGAGIQPCRRPLRLKVRKEWINQ
ncbi:hypothetical protein KC332_g16688 [Hortaea werneckii]|uniref:Uncharacterized protein n=1 Tax=Hortaea werneckii TaxID=91943 RepID=A0A3M7I1X3_HORWE|nr:hypothetical protein KC358_g15702 [Hortaea werneckii]KAI6802560.1 hypothetical protein KC350_g15415 [Hortaea werneckii]KAI6901678.1 hypothetical protein KC348_g16380 [Hortaea werneckii]KAI6922141.1 hypothetical protein KC341_g15541 [Hortaea werneckii]KAI6954256.1 hypothetical protein KC321_g16459 [Hortaea werneckii]